ncbi:MAG: FMN-binding protein [Gammaproteobacteria bacterium]|nr:FMN-binding protein [Gammaproteobacteria bacterium]
MKRRGFAKSLGLALASALLPIARVRATSYLSAAEAQKLLWGDSPLHPVAVSLTEAQRSAIAETSGVRVRNAELRAWKTDSNGWFILDEVIGKHENIDLAVALTAEGKVKGIEILTYRETYGSEVRSPKWLAQFLGKGSAPKLELDRDIQNISGATLSCRHITDGINRLTATWELVLSKL